ncbi:MAG: hypothetical protein B7Z58_13680 [Acidiphilium sp. 37-64-53]|nr:MAG: hypothetical protein B7Z58_13680 [Acidiphilium sp. 37-64-53]
MSAGLTMPPSERPIEHFVEFIFAARPAARTSLSSPRARRTTDVVNVEIGDYPSTDVPAIGEALPFKDNSFDVALSLAVLEHVDDPFKCAQEVLRVVTPGGELLIDVPFLQPVHGFPYHYYNMTAQGLAILFAGQAKVEPPLVCRRLQLLGGWRYGEAEDIEEIFARGPQACGRHGVGACEGSRL